MPTEAIQCTFYTVSDEQSTEELKALQLEREATEEQLAQGAPAPGEAAQHERRADKARYLREKLDERARSEREAAREAAREAEEPRVPEAGPQAEQQR